MVLHMVRDVMATAVSALDETVELYLCLMVGNRGIFNASDFVALLTNHIEQAKGVAGRLEGIKVGSVFNLSSKVLVAAPQDVGEHLENVGSVASLLGHHLLAFGLPPVLGSLWIFGHFFVAWLSQTIEDLPLTSSNILTRLVAVLEGRVSWQSLFGHIERCRSEGTKHCSRQVFQQGKVGCQEWR